MSLLVLELLVEAMGAFFVDVFLGVDDFSVAWAISFVFIGEDNNYGADLVDFGCCAGVLVCLGAWVLERNWLVMDFGYVDVVVSSFADVCSTSTAATTWIFWWCSSLCFRWPSGRLNDAD